MNKIQIKVPKIRKVRGGHRHQVVDVPISAMSTESIAHDDDVVPEGRLVSTEHSGMRRPIPPFNKNSLVL